MLLYKTMKKICHSNSVVVYNAIYISFSFVSCNFYLWYVALFSLLLYLVGIFLLPLEATPHWQILVVK